MSSEIEKIPEIPGVVFPNVCPEKDSELLIGKCSPMFNEHGKMVVRWVSFDLEKKTACFDVLSGEENFVGKRWTADIEPKMPFYACNEEAVSIFLTLA